MTNGRRPFLYLPTSPAQPDLTIWRELADTGQSNQNPIVHFHVAILDVDAATMVESQRTKDRNSLLVKAALRFPITGEQGDVRIRNISSGGLMAEAPVRAARGEPVEIQLKNVGWVSGKVAWIADSRFGIAFDYPIDPKGAQQQIGGKNEEIPSYLRRLDQQVQQTRDKSKIRIL